MAKQDFDGTLPEGFVLAKPIEHTNYDSKVIYELEKAESEDCNEIGPLLITRKRNGWKMYLKVDAKGKISFLTDGLNKIDDAKVSHLIEAAKKLRIPRRSLLVGEATADRNNDDRGKVIGVMHSKDEKKIVSNPTKLHYDLFNIVFWRGRTNNETFVRTYSHLHHLLYKFKKDNEYINLVERLKISFDEAKILSQKNKWEGLVLYDANYKITYRLDGKSPERPAGCYKWKPEASDEFIVRNVIYRPETKIVKKLILLQIDPTTGKEFNCGEYGIFTNKMRKWLSEEAKLPLVVELKFDSRYEKTGKLENPRAFEIRFDKKPENCISPKSYPQASVE